MRLSLRPSGPLTGTLAVPGDKSITHRALLLAAWAPQESEIRNANPGLDCLCMARALQALGAHVRRSGTWPGREPSGISRPVEASDPPGFAVRGTGGTWREPARVLQLGNSGTAMRLLAGAVAGADLFCVLDGDGSLRSRPMDRVTGPLRRMGAHIEGRGHGSLAPLAIRGRPLRGIRHVSPVASAQVKSALLLAGLSAEGETWVVEPRPSRDHTERLLPLFGPRLLHPADGPNSGHIVGVAGGQHPAAARVHVPGDFSSAAFWIVAASIVPGSDLTLTGVGLNPTRTGLLRVLARMGADLEVVPAELDGGEPVGTVRVRHAPLRATAVAGEELPEMIDEVPAWAVAAAFASGDSVLRGGGELRRKESDRLRGMARGLAALGVRVEEQPDGLVIRGEARPGSPPPVRGGRAVSAGDHRLAMAFLVAGLGSREGVEVSGCEMVDTSYPGFYSCATALASSR